MAIGGTTAARLAGSLVLLTVGILGMPTPGPCPQPTHLIPGIAEGLPTLTPPSPHIKLSVRVGYSRGYNGAQKYGVRLVPAYVESDLCVGIANETDPSSSSALCYSHTEISLPTKSHNFLGVGSNLVEMRHYLRRSADGRAGDMLVIGVVCKAYPPVNPPQTNLVDRALVSDLGRLLVGQVNIVAFDFTNLLPSPAHNLPYYQYRAGQGEQCEMTDWVVYGAKLRVSSSLVEALKTHYKNNQTTAPGTTDTTDTTSATTTSDSPAVSPILYRPQGTPPIVPDHHQESPPAAKVLSGTDLDPFFRSRSAYAHPPSNQIILVVEPESADDEAAELESVSHESDTSSATPLFRRHGREVQETVTTSTSSASPTADFASVDSEIDEILTKATAPAITAETTSTTTESTTPTTTPTTTTTAPAITTETTSTTTESTTPPTTTTTTEKPVSYTIKPTTTTTTTTTKSRDSYFTAEPQIRTTDSNFTEPTETPKTTNITAPTTNPTDAPRTSDTTIPTTETPTTTEAPSSGMCGCGSVAVVLGMVLGSLLVV